MGFEGRGSEQGPSWPASKADHLAQWRFRPAEAPRPDDFETVFVRIGRLACEEHYSVGDKRITGWLEEAGKDRLTAARAEHVRQLRANARKHQAAQDKQPPALKDFRFVDPEIARAAADHLRIKRNGGWPVSMTRDGDWCVGITRKSPAQLVDMAVRYGFDASAATLRGEGNSGVGSR